MRVAFAGTSAFAVPTLERLVEGGHDVGLVITQPDRPAGRGLRLHPSPVKQAALTLDLEIIQPERIRSPEALASIEASSPQLLVVAAYGQILPPALLALPARGAINVHASLLPRHRGAAPVAWAILAGDTETGVTIMQMDAGVDTGPMLAQARTPIGDRERRDELEARLARLGADLLMETLQALEQDRVTPRPQPAGATEAPRLVSADGRLRVEMSAQEIDRRVRALSPTPGCWLALAQGEVRVLRGHLGEDREAGIPIETADGVYFLDEVQPAGGRPMAAAAWLRGRR